MKIENPECQGHLPATIHKTIPTSFLPLQTSSKLTILVTAGFGRNVIYEMMMVIPLLLGGKPEFVSWNVPVPLSPSSVSLGANHEPLAARLLVACCNVSMPHATTCHNSDATCHNTTLWCMLPYLRVWYATCHNSDAACHNITLWCTSMPYLRVW